MKVKFKLFAVGEHEFHSNKTGRDIRQARLIGTLVDAYDGSELPAVADMGFDGSMLSGLKMGDVVLLDVTEYKTENAMAKLKFSAMTESSKGSK